MRQTKLQPGQVLAERYRIERLIGIGGMSSVFLATDLKVTGKQWAVKESVRHALRPDLFVREAEAMAGLEHPFLPKIADFCGPDAEGFSYIVMEYIRGESLQSRFDRVGKMDWREAVGYAIELCELFAYLHRLEPEPIIYRDLKPANVMIDLSGHIRLIDFGIARKQTRDGQSDTIRLGTAGFAAPEQFRADGQSDARTDLYTLGAMLYYLLSGGLYHRDRLEPIGVYAPQLPEALQHTIERLLAPAPADRPLSADELKRSLSALLVEKPSQTAIASTRASRKLVLVGGLFAGSGSTFVTVSLARALHRFGVSATVIECGCNEPELYALLAREKGSGRNKEEANESSEWAEPSISWTEGFTTWRVLSPKRHSLEGWSAETAYRKVLYAETEVVLLDVSTHWHDPVVRELLRVATDVIAVVAPSASRVAATPALAIWELLQEWRAVGKRVHIAVNRDCRFAGSEEWRRALPIEATARLPELPSPQLRTAEWSGIAAADRSDLWELLRPEVVQLLEAIFSKGTFKQRSPKIRFFGKKRKFPLA